MRANQYASTGAHECKKASSVGISALVMAIQSFNQGNFVQWWGFLNTNSSSEAKYKVQMRVSHGEDHFLHAYDDACKCKQIEPFRQ